MLIALESQAVLTSRACRREVPQRRASHSSPKARRATASDARRARTPEEDGRPQRQLAKMPTPDPRRSTQSTQHARNAQTTQFVRISSLRACACMTGAVVHVPTPDA
eukprot:4418501-Pleurochrysis_carterae.AAC.1